MPDVVGEILQSMSIPSAISPIKTPVKRRITEYDEEAPAAKNQRLDLELMALDEEELDYEELPEDGEVDPSPPSSPVRTRSSICEVGPPKATAIAKEMIELLSGHPSVVASAFHGLSRQLAITELRHNESIGKLEEAVGELRRGQRQINDTQLNLKREFQDHNREMRRRNDSDEKWRDSFTRLGATIKCLDARVATTGEAACQALTTFSAALTSSTLKPPQEPVLNCASREQSDRECAKMVIDINNNSHLVNRDEKYPHFDAPIRKSVKSRVIAPLRRRDENWRR